MSNLKSMEITTRIGCQIGCSYCPQSLLVKEYSKRGGDVIFKFESFKACLDKIPRDVRIHFSGFAEPWLNNDCTRMLLYSFERGFPRIVVNTTCVGMSVEDIAKIKHIPFDLFMVHLPDNTGNARIPITKEYINVVKNIKNSKIKNLEFMTMGALHSSLSKEFDSLINRCAGRMVSRSGNVGKVSRIRKQGKITCGSASGLEHNVLLPNGDVVLCCMDYGMKHILGNLLEDVYENLFTGNEFKSILKHLDQDTIDEPICRFCEYASNEEIPAGKDLHILAYGPQIIRRSKASTCGCDIWCKASYYSKFISIILNKIELPTIVGDVEGESCITATIPAELLTSLPKGPVELKLHHKYRDITSLPMHIDVQ